MGLGEIRLGEMGQNRPKQLRVTARALYSHKGEG